MKTKLGFDSECPSFGWARGEKIDLRDKHNAHELSACEIHMKPDGARDDSPSFVFVLKAPYGHIFHQISLKKLLPAVDAAIQAERERHECL